MIKKFLVSLRRKPKSVRNNVALATAGGFTFIVFVIWAFNLPTQLESRNGEQATKIFSSFFNSVEESVSEVEISPEKSLADFVAEATSVSSTTNDESVQASTSVETSLGATTTISSEDADADRVVRISTTTSSSSSTTE